MAQNLDLRCVLVPAPWVLGPHHVSNSEYRSLRHIVFAGQNNPVSVLLMGNYKLLVGTQQQSYWQGSVNPVTQVPAPTVQGQFQHSAMRPPCYSFRGNSHTRGNIWKFSVEGLQSCGPCGAAGHPWPEPCPHCDLSFFLETGASVFCISARKMLNHELFKNTSEQNVAF